MGKQGRLTVVGTGISFGQLTLEARGALEGADRVLYLLADPIAERWIQENTQSPESLYGLYEDGKPRITTYLEMIDRMLECVRSGEDVCAAFYGHPGVFAFPPHEVVRRARREGFVARMLPGVSAEDCLFADVGIDPAMGGCQSFEATDFLIHDRRFDPTSHLILWQIGVLGHLDFQSNGYEQSRLSVLEDELVDTYGADHEVVLYEASLLNLCESEIDRYPLERLASRGATAQSTLYVPPLEARPANAELMQRLEIDLEEANRISQVLGSTAAPSREPDPAEV